MILRACRSRESRSDCKISCATRRSSFGPLPPAAERAGTLAGALAGTLIEYTFDNADPRLLELNSRPLKNCKSGCALCAYAHLPNPPMRDSAWTNAPIVGFEVKRNISTSRGRFEPKRHSARQIPVLCCSSGASRRDIRAAGTRGAPPHACERNDEWGWHV